MGWGPGAYRGGGGELIGISARGDGLVNLALSSVVACDVECELQVSLSLEARDLC